LPYDSLSVARRLLNVFLRETQLLQHGIKQTRASFLLAILHRGLFVSIIEGGMAAFAMSLLKPNFNAFGLSQFTDGFYEVINVHEVDYRTKMSYVNDSAPNQSVVKRGRRSPRFSESGGIRVITFFSGPPVPVFVLTVFGKGEKINLSKFEQDTCLPGPRRRSGRRARDSDY